MSRSLVFEDDDGHGDERTARGAHVPGAVRHDHGVFSSSERRPGELTRREER